jgi:hypothetical protein
MLSSERLEMSTKEEEKVNALIESYADEGESVGITRADPGETGALLVSIGNDTWRVTEARSTKLKED